MPRIDRDQVIGPDGTIISDVAVERPVRVVTDEQMKQAKATLKTMWQTFTTDGQPSGTPTAVQMRNWNLALTVAARFLANELDDE
jgi:hypothetical protein